MATVTFLVHPDRPDALALATDTATWLTERGHVARILRFSGPDQVSDDGVEMDLAAVDLAGTTVAVSMGGDGTFLRVVRLAAAEDVPVLGRQLRPPGLPPGPPAGPGARRADQGLRGPGRSSRPRCALDVAISDRSLGDGMSLAACPERGGDREDRIRPHGPRWRPRVDGEEALTYSADGLIVATPTGSTAYNLSAGGPILAPTLRAMVVTPVAPHFSLDRSLVLTDEQEVKVEVVPDRAGVLVIDGEEVGRLQPGATVTCRVAARPVRVVRNEPQTFGSILRFRLLADRER